MKAPISKPKHSLATRQGLNSCAAICTSVTAATGEGSRVVNLLTLYMVRVEIVGRLRKELVKNVDAAYRQQSFKFFKEPVKLLGARSPVVRKLARDFFIEIQGADKNDVWTLVENLLATGYNELQIIAFDWVFRLRKKYQPSDFMIFVGWLKKYVANWGSCDDFCCHALGYFLMTFSEFAPELRKWSVAKNRWLRRASMVALIPGLRQGRFLEETLANATTLLEDEDDLVRKGCGWTLKEASFKSKTEVFDFVMAHKNRMPRVALRYAIEKLPASMRRQAME